MSNMRYTLYASEVEWKAWHVKLGKFWKYFENASRTPIESPPRTFGLPALSPNSVPNLPSPPASTHTSPPYAPSHTFTTTPLHPHPLSMPPYLPPAAPSPLGPLPGIDSRSATRKRSHDYGHESLEPPAKRFNSSVAPSVNSSTTLTPSTSVDFTPGTNLTTPSFGPGSSSSAPRLPMPNLSVSTGNQHNTYPTSSSAQLPYSGTNSRPTTLPSVGRVTQSGMLPSLHQTVNGNHPGTHNNPPMSDWPARQSPFAAGSATPSPTTFNFPSSTHTPQHLSPASFIIPRNSPYKPVRSVNTLLVPPPSASMHNPPEQLSYGQMHYLPLGKPASQPRPGVLPSMHHDSSGQPHDMPLYLPQPRFSR